MDEQKAFPVPVGRRERWSFGNDGGRGLGRQLRTSKSEVSPERRRRVWVGRWECDVWNLLMNSSIVCWEVV